MKRICASRVEKASSKNTTHEYILNYQCDDNNYHLSAIFALEEGLHCINKIRSLCCIKDILFSFKLDFRTKEDQCFYI